MEVIAGTAHAEFPMTDASCVGEARRHAAQLARQCGLDDTAAGQLALVVTELGTNALRHAHGGRLLLAPRAGRRGVEVIAVDEGPGIASLERSLHDGYSTGGTPGTGLGAVRRLASDFHIHSASPGGTLVLAIVEAAAARPAPVSRICAGAVSVCAPGERVCGDGWVVALDGARAALLVADGLGHGPDAAEAAQAAVAIFGEDPFADPRTQLERVHAGLRGTRGAAVLLLQADADAGVVRSAGAGNVVARLVSGTTDRTLLTQHGTAGVSMRTPEEVQVPWPPHALLVVCTDGIQARWKPELVAPLLGRDPSLAAALLLREHGRGRDDATAVVLRRSD